MKTTILLTTFLVGLSLLAVAQTPPTSQTAPADSSKVKPKPKPQTSPDDPGYSFIPRVVPPSTEALALQRYGDYPVGHTTGVPNITIPIYTINTGKLKLPITISYHAGGFKPEEKSGILGLGWTLNAGGRISRTVLGDPDELTRPPDQFIPADQLAGTTLAATDDNRRLYLDVLAANENGSGTDLEADIFYYDYPGGNGKFMLKNITNASGGYTRQKQPVTIPFVPIKITGSPASFSVDLAHLEIVDESGVTYRYGRSVDGTLDAWEETYPDASGQANVQKSSWLLTDIIAQGGKETIKLNYATRLINNRITQSAQAIAYSAVPANQAGEPDISSIIQSDAANLPHCCLTTSIGGVTASLHYVSLLTSIVFPNGKVLFSYQNGGYSPNNYEGNKLQTVEVYDNANSLIQKHSFVQANYVNDNNRYKLTDLRRLGTVSGNVCENQHFDYKEPDRVAPLNSSLLKGLDYWRFYNGHDENVDLIPANYRVEVGIRDGAGAATLYNYYLTPPGVNREANEEFTKSYVLRKITHPTNGTTEFEFEGNKFWWSGATKNAGGLRVKRIINTPVAGKQEIKSYKYAGDDRCEGCGDIRLNPYELQSFVNYSYQFNQEIRSDGFNNYCIPLLDRVISLSSEFVDGSSNFEMSPVFYTTITEFVGDETDNQGKTVYTYELPQVRFGVPRPWARYLGAIDNWKGSNFLGKEVYKYADAGYILIQKEVITYVKTTRDVLQGQKINVFNINTSSRSPVYPFAICGTDKDAYQLFDYTISTGVALPSSKTVIINADVNGGQKMVEDYTYFPNFNQPFAIYSTNSKSQSTTRIFNRPFNYIDKPTYINMVAANVLNPVIEDVSYIESTPIKTITTDYDCASGDFGTSFPCLYVPVAMKTREYGTLRTEIAFDKYNEFGYPAQYTEKNGIITALTWYTDSSKANSLASQTIGLGTTLAKTTNYDYAPLVGMSQFTDAAGYNTFYSYDELNRLKTVKDHANNILKAATYNLAASSGCAN
jgi:hypothetical protein